VGVYGQVAAQQRGALLDAVHKMNSEHPSDGEQLEQLCTMDAGEQKQNSAPTTEEEKENHQQRNDISKL
jgi:hypothetical protein